MSFYNTSIDNDNLLCLKQSWPPGGEDNSAIAIPNQQLTPPRTPPDQISTIKSTTASIPTTATLTTTPPPTRCQHEIIDIRSSKTDLSLKKEIAASFLDVPDGSSGERSLPTMLLYDAEGLKLFEKITYLEEYYLTAAEIGILEKWAGRIASRIPDGGVVVELGSGNLRKVSILLHALAAQGKKITYYALDLSRPELERTLSQIPETLPASLITCIGLHGTYDDGSQWLSTHPTLKSAPKCILWLGSSIGNFDREDATLFLKNIVDNTLNMGDVMVIGIDGCKEEEKVYKAYNDSFGISKEFELNALVHANRILEKEVFKLSEWEYLGEWNAEEGRHQACFVAKDDLVMSVGLFGRDGVDEVRIRKGERVKIERSYKFGEEEVEKMWMDIGMVEVGRWGNKDVGVSGGNARYNLHMITRPPFKFPLSPSEYAPRAYPTLAEWAELWKAWDIVTTGMIPRTHLLSKPIDLRNPCIFYLGHIPTFLDMHLTLATKLPLVVPERYTMIFERGIDPDVQDPRSCHRHSKAPEVWPDVDEILEYGQRVRERVRGFYDADGVEIVWSGEGNSGRERKVLMRELWLGYEHEAMHLETLLYMLVQSPYTLPPPGVLEPDYVSEGERWRGKGSGDVEELWIDIPPTSEEGLTIGLHDPEEADDDAVVNDDEEGRGNSMRHFGWDNEKPLRKGVKVAGFQSQPGPITVGDYYNYLVGLIAEIPTIVYHLPIPASWEMVPSSSSDSGGRPENMALKLLNSIRIRTVFANGQNGEEKLLRITNPYVWVLPVVASYNQLERCAESMGGRIPTREELLRIYEVAEERREGEVAGEEAGGSGLFKDFATARGSAEVNVGFAKGWGYTPVRDWLSFQGGDEVNKRSDWPPRLRGRGETGGAWEWTSTVFEEPEGFVPQRSYAEYSRDFFDGKHNVVLGGGWATVPRIAGRKSFVNWYQRGYQYMWCTARMVRDYEREGENLTAYWDEGEDGGYPYSSGDGSEED